MTVSKLRTGEIDEQRGRAGQGTQEQGTFSLVSKSTNMKASRVELTSEIALNQLSGASKVIKKMTLHPTDFSIYS